MAAAMPEVAPVISATGFVCFGIQRSSFRLVHLNMQK
jgi:hypothetical protein